MPRTKPLVLAFCVTVSAVFLPCDTARAEDPCAEGNLKPSAAVQVNTLYLKWTGKIISPMSERLLTEFDKAKKRVKYVVLTLSSCGGSLKEAERVIAVLRSVRSTHTLQTVVDRGATCGSACVPVFLQGERRRAALTSSWLFHEVGRWTAKDKSRLTANRSLTERTFQDYFLSAGVSETWLNQLRILVQHADYWQTGQNLWESGSGVIMDPIDNHVARGTERQMF